MGFAYTPGLTVSAHTTVRKVRRLPLKGRVLVKVGDRVKAEDVVAKTDLPGEVKPVNVAGKLGVGPDDLKDVMLKKEGDPVRQGEAFAQTKGFFGLFKGVCTSPIDGTIESISHVTGQVIIRGAPTPVEKFAFVLGAVIATEESESATVEAKGTFIQGIFGIGGETWGPLEIVVDSPDAVLEASLIKPEHKDRILVGGGLVTAAAMKAAMKHGVKGIVAGGLDDADLRDLLGFDLGVAITGEEQLGVTLVLTEGFGHIRMARATFELLKERRGMLASINGATQIRAGVTRPEIIVPLGDDAQAKDPEKDEMAGILQVGTSVRAIREPYFGRIGKCAELPVELTKLATEAKVRVLKVEFEDGEIGILPRANIELINE
jgi:hypothetical protein